SKRGALARREMRIGKELVAPDHVYVESASALRRRWLVGSLNTSEFADAIADLSDLPIDTYASAPLLSRAYELRDNMTPYDAAYVALAEGLDCPLITADRRLAAAPGVRC